MRLFHLSWATLRDYLLILLGAFMQALGLRLFLIPAHLASGGVSGISQLINHYTGWPIGLMVFFGNLPLFLLGW
ncbi:MAG: YitT family protein, partial [Chloroflexi bacterium]|nr:YitT family protein [Chloroflexota bacterium]